MRLTLSELERLKEEGRIKDFTVVKKNKSTTVKVNARSKTKEWIEKNLWAWARANKLMLETEVYFHPDRKWRFDFALPEKKIAIEYEGVMSEKSRHTTITGYTGDIDKYNAAQQLGWKVLRYTAKNYKQMIEDLNKILGEG